MLILPLSSARMMGRTYLGCLAASGLGGGSGGGLGGGSSGSGGASGLGGGDGAREGRADGAELDVGVGDGGVGDLSLNISGDTRGGGARTTRDTGLGSISGSGVVGVEPESVGIMIVPDGEGENHSLGEGGVHALQATLGSKVVLVTEEGLIKVIC